jgi:uncharacterized membrane protein
MRESGPVRKVFENEELGLEGQRLAAPYIGAARLFLGMLKNQMRLSGQDSGSWSRRLPDGTVISVESRFGQDKFTVTTGGAPPVEEVIENPPIEVPPEEGFEVPIPTQDIDATLYAAAGWCTQDGRTFAVAWRSLNALPEEVGPPSARSSQATHISDDGSTVVGYYTPADGGSQRAFRYQHATGAVDLPVAGHPSQASNVSREGGTVVGFQTTASGSRPFVWTAADGVQELPDVQFVGIASRVSPAGQYIGGSETITNVLVPYQQAVVWHRLPNGAWSKYAIDNPGTSSRDDHSGGIGTPRADHYGVADIDDLGRATLVVNSQTGVAVSGGHTYWQFHLSGPAFVGEVDGQFYPDLPNAFWQVDQPVGWAFLRFEWANKRITPMATGSAAAMADDVQVVAGTDNYGTRVTYVAPVVPGQHSLAADGTHLGDNYAFQITLFNYIAPGTTVSHAWWWSARRGQVVLQPENTAALDISEDGSVIVGWRRDDSNPRPCYWLRGRGVAATDMPFPGVEGQAVAVARPVLPTVSI